MIDWFILIEPARERYSDALSQARREYMAGVITTAEYEARLLLAHQNFFLAKESILAANPQ